MIAKTFVTAFLAASFMAGTHASPCKASSRTIDVSATVEISSTATSIEGSGTTQAISSITDASSVEDTTLTVSQSDTSSAVTSSEGVTTTTAVSTINISTTVVESSTGASTIVDNAATAVTSTLGFTSSVQESSIETLAVSAETTTTAIVTTTESTTTSAESLPAPTFLLNGGFDDEPDTTTPWTRASGIFTLSLSSTIKHDGRNSAELKYTSSGQSAISQQLGVTPQAGIDYPVSAWFRPGVGCLSAIITCTYSNGLRSSGNSLIVSALANQWVELSHTCNYSQAQIDAGGLQLYVGFWCPRDAIAWIDSVTFTE